jgi:hypothetical protein
MITHFIRFKFYEHPTKNVPFAINPINPIIQLFFLGQQIPIGFSVEKPQVGCPVQLASTGSLTQVGPRGSRLAMVFFDSERTELVISIVIITQT